MQLYIILVLSIKGAFTASEGWFWHVTDFHWDYTYFDSKLSCNGKSVPNRGMFGDYWCDSPWNLVNDSVHAMKRIQPNADFILWTGDSVLHTTDENLKTEINDAIIGNITSLLMNNFQDIPVYATFGNHDYYPNDQHPGHVNLLYNLTLDKWRDWIKDEEQNEGFQKGGYYTVKTEHGLRIMALNTNLYYHDDKVTAGQTDPAGQFDWMEKVLAGAARNKEKVLVTGHIAPGVYPMGEKRTPGTEMYEHHNRRFNEVMLQHSDVIVGMHFGHAHEDGLRVYIKNEIPVMSVFIAPSVTPWRWIVPSNTAPAHNPGIRLVKYERNTGRHLDLVQYFVDLPRSNSIKKTEWEVEYTASKDYRIPDLTPMSLHKLVKKMENAASDEFKQYYLWKTVSSRHPSNKNCDKNCHSKIVCCLTSFDMESFRNCIEASTSGNARIFLTLISLIPIFLFILV